MKVKNGVTQYIGVIMALGASVIGLMIYVLVIQAFQGTQTAGSLAYNVTGAGLLLFSGVTSQFGTIGTISGVLILAAVVFAFGFGGYMVYNKVRGE